MNSMTVIQALIIAIWVALVESRSLGYATLTLRFSPLMTGLVVGIVLGNVPDAMIVTAAIQLIYMGVVAPGGTLPSEPAIASAIAVSVALLGNLSAQEAVAVAVPVGLLGSYLYQFRFFLNTFFTKAMDKYAAEADDKGLTLSIMVIPTIISFILFIPMLFIALYWGAPVISSAIASISSGPVLHILEVVGGGLAALGIAVIMQVIGKKSLLIFFFLAYFMSVSLRPLGINTVTYAIFGCILAGMYVLFTANKAEANA